MLGTSEHWNLIAQFERDFKGENLEREDRDMWAKSHIYKNGNVNNLFLAYRMGYSYGKVA